MLDVAEGGGITGVIDQQVGVCRPEAEVGIAEPLLLAGGREDGDDGEVHHPALDRTTLLLSLQSRLTLPPLLSSRRPGLGNIRISSWLERAED